MLDVSLKSFFRSRSQISAPQLTLEKKTQNPKIIPLKNKLE
jgi:hypothetical protein